MPSEARSETPLTTSDRKAASLDHAIPAVLLLVMALLYAGISSFTANQVSPAGGLFPSIDISKFEGQFFWSVSIVMFLVALIWNGSIALNITAKASWAIQVIIYVACFVFGLLIFSEPVQSATAKALLEPLDNYQRYPPSVLVVFINSIAAMVVVLTVGAVGVLSHHATSQLSVAIERQTAQLNRLLLFSSATLLVAGVIEVACLCFWAASTYAPAANTNARHVATVLAIAAGAFYTFALLVIYVPAFYAQECRISQLAERNTQVDPQTWRKTYGLHHSMSSSLGNLLAFASPLLSSLFSLLLK